MKKGEVIGSLLILFLTVWGCWALVQTWKKESVWTPRISFYVPRFMFKANPQTRAPDPLSTTALPAPEPATQPVDLSATYVFSNTPLPIIEADQSLEKETNAALKYKKPYTRQPHKKQIALLLSPVGLNDQTTAAVLSALPEQVTLAFSADAPHLKTQIESARRHGFETMLFIPMETTHFPAYDSGETAVYSFQDDATNQSVLQAFLSGPLPVSGVVTQDTAVMEKMPDFDDLMKRAVSDKGLLYISTEPVSVPFNKAADFDFKENFYPQALDAYRRQIEQTAQNQGYAIAVFPPIPVVLQTLAQWISENSKPDIEFVPVSALFTENDK